MKTKKEDKNKELSVKNKAFILAAVGLTTSFLFVTGVISLLMDKYILLINPYGIAVCVSSMFILFYFSFDMYVRANEYAKKSRGK